jgi:modulator of FtsH protease
MSVEPGAWVNFFAAEVGAAATLTGLLVVAISINLARIITVPHLPGRAAEGLVTLVAALALSSLALMPDQKMLEFGTEACVIGLIALGLPLRLQLTSLHSTPHLSTGQKLLRALINITPGLFFVIGGALVVAGVVAGLTWLAAGVLVSLVAGVWNAWVLLVEILR